MPRMRTNAARIMLGSDVSGLRVPTSGGGLGWSKARKGGADTATHAAAMNASGLLADASGSLADATIVFAPIFTSHMVLQQAPARSLVFGSVQLPSVLHLMSVTVVVTMKALNTTVSHTVAAQMIARSTERRSRGDRSNIDYAWEARLRPVDSHHEWTIHAALHGPSIRKRAELSRVAFGDVWFCAGQSNMLLPVGNTYGRNDSIRAALAGQRNHIRMLPIQMPDVVTADGAWPLVGTWATARHAAQHPPVFAGASSTAPAGAVIGLDQFCATCYYFAEALTEAFVRDRRPPPTLGLVCSAAKSTFIEEYFPPDQPAEKECSHVMGDPRRGNGPFRSLFPKLIEPFVRMSIKGWLWQQGEHNLQTNAVSGNSAGGFGYGCELPALIRIWRDRWAPVLPSPLAPFGIATQFPAAGWFGARDFGGMRWAQTGNYGVTPNPAMPHTFSAQAYDLPDPWAVNASCSAWKCCPNPAQTRAQNPRAQASPSLFYDRAVCLQHTVSIGGPSVCDAYCEAQRMVPDAGGALHSRLKRPIGHRLAIAANVEVYGGSGAATGPVVAGCTVDTAQQRLVVRFNRSLMRGESLVWRQSAPSMFEVQTNASSWCVQPQVRCPPSGTVFGSDRGNCPWRERYVWCPPDQRGPQYAPSASVRPRGGQLSGVVPVVGPMLAAIPSEGDIFEDGWRYVETVALDTARSSVELDLQPLQGTPLHAIRFAWGVVSSVHGGERLCCRGKLGDPDGLLVGLSKPCEPAACALGASGGLPANPFMAKIVNGRCECLEPQTCDG